MKTPHRYSSRPFPPYRYIPGRAPHPSRDPDGYQFGANGDPPTHFDPEAWDECGPYLYGVDLFNHGYWWAAHEAWEGCWIAAGRTTVHGRFLQGLIQIAAACLKREQALDDAAARLAREALERFPVDQRCMLGIDLAQLHAAATVYAIERRGSPPRITLSMEN